MLENINTFLNNTIIALSIHHLTPIKSIEAPIPIWEPQYFSQYFTFPHRSGTIWAFVFSSGWGSTRGTILHRTPDPPRHTRSLHMPGHCATVQGYPLTWTALLFCFLFSASIFSIFHRLHIRVGSKNAQRTFDDTSDTVMLRCIGHRRCG